MLFDISGEQFKTKKALTERVREILYKSDTLSYQDNKFMCELLERHPGYEGKKGCGIDYIYVGKDSYHKKCFWIKRLDGTTTDFSFITCINGEPSHRAQFFKSCRNAIRKDMVDFKIEALDANPYCAVSGVPLHDKMSHVDHAYPYEFNTIVLMFIEKYNLDINKVKIAKGGDGNTITEFEDKRLDRLFLKFHRAVAKLRLVHWHVNLSDLRKKSKAA